MAVEGVAAKEEVSERLSQLRADVDATISRLASVTGTTEATVKDAVRSAMQNGPEKELERVNMVMVTKAEMEERIAELAADKENAVAQLTATTQAAVQDVAALKERMEEMQSMALQSMATKEEVEKQFGQLKLHKDATIERLSSMTGTLDAAVKDAVSAAMKDGPERELERVKASLKELSSPEGGGVLQSRPKTIHAFD
eukprot:2381136-Amphidinium_carterae.1